jgi:AraC-like DNA-binding protein
MVLDYRLDSGANQVRLRSADGIESDVDARSRLPKSATETAQWESRGGTASLLSERNGQAGVICAEAVRIAQDICHAVQRDPESARVAALQLVTLLTPSTAAGKANARGGLAPWQMRKIDQYLRVHLTRSVRVDELANQVPMSVSYFHRAFKETYGDPPHEYIIRLRVELAQKLMLTSADSLTQIALACGFANHAHLSKSFRRLVGEPPSAWRRRNLSDAQPWTGSQSLENCEPLSSSGEWRV